jgi:hypothetical protein
MLKEAMLYEYQSLQDPGSELRVAILQPGSREDEIGISFRTQRITKERISVQLVRRSVHTLTELKLIVVGYRYL